jgi:capsular polysaccharide biosynthesis protein
MAVETKVMKSAKDQINEMLNSLGLTVQEISENDGVRVVRQETEKGISSIFSFFRDTLMGVLMAILVSIYLIAIMPSLNIYRSYKCNKGLVKHKINL